MDNIRNPKVQEQILKLIQMEGYSDIQIVGQGSFGMVIKARNELGSYRAIKVLCSYIGNSIDIEYKLAQLLATEESEVLYGQIIQTFKAVVYYDE